MTKLYYTDPYMTHFTAEVTSVVEKESLFHIVLDQTTFYPEGGGQPCDTGFIEDCPITSVYEEAGVIYHVSSKKPIKIHKAKCHIDWARRFDHMQQHMAQHILSACLREHFNATTLSFHLGSETCTIDIDTMLLKDMLPQAETLANAVISSYALTTILYPTKQELKKLPLPKPLPKVEGQLRLVQIGDVDLSACCGTHPRTSLEVQLIKIIKAEKHKNGMRLYFLAGNRALHALLTNEAAHLSTIEDLTKTSQKLQGEVRLLQSTVMDYEVKEVVTSAPTVNGTRIVSHIYDDLTPKALQTMATKLVSYDHTIALLGLKVDGMAHLVYMCSADMKNLNMSNLLKDSITLIDGRGGGTPTSAQGGGKSVANLTSAMDYTLMKVKKALA
ncbi:MAG: alanyl-tRNA editing protein [Cellulosilyticaceae bacterium]